MPAPVSPRSRCARAIAGLPVRAEAHRIVSLVVVSVIVACTRSALDTTPTARVGRLEVAAIEVASIQARTR